MKWVRKGRNISKFGVRTYWQKSDAKLRECSDLFDIFVHLRRGSIKTWFIRWAPCNERESWRCAILRWNLINISMTRMALKYSVHVIWQNINTGTEEKAISYLCHVMSLFHFVIVCGYRRLDLRRTPQQRKKTPKFADLSLHWSCQNEQLFLHRSFYAIF